MKHKVGESVEVVGAGYPKGTVGAIIRVNKKSYRLAMASMNGSWEDTLKEDEVKTREFVYLCLSHKREATHTDKNGKRCCNPALGGILLPCSVMEYSI